MEEHRVHAKRNRRNSGSVAGSQTTTEPGKCILLVGISFGLLCIIQASLNVYLRLYLPPDMTPCDNLTAERDALEKLLQTSHQDLLKQKDQLQKSHSCLEACEQALSQKRDEMVPPSDDYPSEEWVYTFDDRVYQPEGWVYFQCSLYLGSTTEQTWHESRQYCQQRGAELIIISSVQEQEFAHSTFKGRRWIGLSDLEQEGVWKWVDGSLVSTRFWADGEPNNDKGDEDCVELNFSNNLLNWNDRNCTVTNMCICEKRQI